MKYIILILITVILFITQTSKSNLVTVNNNDSTAVVYEYKEISTKKTGNSTFNYYMKCVNIKPLTQKQINNVIKAVEKGKLTEQEKELIFNKDKQLR